MHHPYQTLTEAYIPPRSITILLVPVPAHAIWMSVSVLLQKMEAASGSNAKTSRSPQIPAYLTKHFLR